MPVAASAANGGYSYRKSVVAIGLQIYLAARPLTEVLWARGHRQRK